MSFSTMLFVAFIAIVSIQVIYYLSFLFAFATKPAEKRLKQNLPVSIIVCAKNEAKNLKENLPALINQKYPNFEIVLVNDSSSDDTLEVMKTLKNQNDNISIVDVKENEAFWGNKKYALTLGIKASKNDFLIFTDADCLPVSDMWLANIAGHFSNAKSIVLGYGAYRKKPLSLLNKLIRFETLMTALQYFSYAILGLPYMGVGRNMAYRKELFFNNSGFNNHMHVKSGDDDLLINEMATKENTAICFTKASFTLSEPKSSFNNWFYQKRRHVSTARLYKVKHKALLGLFYISQLAFWILALFCFLIMDNWQLVLILFCLRLFVQYASVGISSNKLLEKDLILLIPILDLFLVITQLFIFITNLISKPKHWK
ncbi:glycosyltransferase [Winogradskyella alexanderae]|uniref:Glycosyltransferase n=1 Tax=Winogradskyella alexanderae TaxID=2877123 RepID=A0ABS7XSK9_9FLAO|nr:glycosyltransferase [Winogradskyella alexanderae]MCA0133009.1 glycosyltransferase [Winogradskyella alexanderae]